MEEYRAGNTGKLVTWSIVHRSYPGIEVPFVSAIVDLDDGLTLKANLTGCDAEDLHEAMPVTLEFDDAGGAKDKEGNSFVAYHFVAQPIAEKELSQ
ncbi:MAG: OB-fold domain-containing protein [Sphingomonadaceae bacterium]|nr:OB-fold domain-containing protein [Sphingomonadaceae bacterium]